MNSKRTKINNSLNEEDNARYEKRNSTKIEKF
jgi:hypothetical protein